jgi:hypothetical protein
MRVDFFAVFAVQVAGVKIFGLEMLRRVKNSGLADWQPEE